MRRPVVADEAGPVEREHDRQLLHRDVVHDLIVGALQEGRIDRADGLDAARRSAGTETDGVRFSDPDVEVALRKALGELCETGAVGHRGRDADDARVALGRGDQRVGERRGERRPGRFLLDLPFIGMVRVGADAVERAAVELGDVVTKGRLGVAEPAPECCPLPLLDGAPGEFVR